MNSAPLGGDVTHAGAPATLRKAMSIRARLVVLVAAVLAPHLLLAIFIGVRYVGAERKVIEAERFDIVNNLADLLQRETERVKGVLESLAVSPDLADGRFELFRRHAESASQLTGIEAILLADQAGGIAVATGVASLLPQQGPPEAEGAFAGTAVISGVTTSGGDPRPTFSISVPVRRGGQVVQSLTAIVLAEHLRGLFAEAGMPDEWVAAIVDRKGRFLARSRDADKLVGGPARRELADAAAGPADKGTFDNVTLDGFTVSNSFRRLPASGWTSVVAVPRELLNAPRDRALALIAAAGVLLTGIGIGLAMLLSWRIREPLRELSNAALSVVAGKEPPHMPVAIAELEEVKRAFTVAAQIAKDRLHAEGRLRTSEARFRGTFENAAVGMSHVTLDGHFTLVNDRLCEILGHTREELLATTKSAITHPDDLAADRANFARLLSGEIESYSVDKRYIRKDGEAVWAGVTVSLLHGEAGEPDHVLSVVRDIAVRKSAQDQQRFLMRELSHRTKNLLAVIQAMARQTARGGGTHEDFLRRFNLRLNGIAASHDLLVHQNWQGVGLAELVRQQLSPFTEAEGARTTVEGPALTVNAEAAQAIGLAIHELATNAIKYGAFSVQAGRVAVVWRLDTLDGSEQVSLEWRETNGPAVNPPSQKGIGHFVTDSMISQSLEGHVTVQYPPEGLRWKIIFPASNIAKRAPSATHG